MRLKKLQWGAFSSGVKCLKIELKGVVEVIELLINGSKYGIITSLELIMMFQNGRSLIMDIKKMEITAAVKQTWGPNYDRVAAIQEYNRRKELPGAYPGEMLVQDKMTQAYYIVVEKK